MFSPIPTSLGRIEVDCPELVYHVYMPIKMANDYVIRVPPHLECFLPLIGRAMSLGCIRDDHYIYLTVKKMYVQAGQSANRMGWHIDGYGSDDTNFIWSDCLPTEFVTGVFNLSQDHALSMIEMQEQAKGRPIHTLGNCELIMLTPTNVHRVAECTKDCLRTFVKISVSTEQYNLKGNAHNYMFDYDWPMVDRIAERNHPTK